ncbi:hypothetical protein pipiens_003730 [Culex pipiens pipiens]|uniref:MIF4G-like type 2 domain-containing protein n=1 Tax=Culex pipiens pipiens TaxID=38569 RepID=A0ABD1CTL2_CULPP
MGLLSKSHYLGGGSALQSRQRAERRQGPAGSQRGILVERVGSRGRCAEAAGGPTPRRRKKTTGDDADKPTEEQVERMEEKLEAAYVDQKRLFLIIFQRFIMILSEHLVKCDTDGRDYDTDWYRWTVGRLQQVFMLHHEQVQKYSSTLESLLFTSDIDPHILDVFHQFTALRS